MALVILGVGVLAFVEAQQAFIKSNTWSSQAATGTLLANEVRELMRRLPRHDPVTGLWLESSGGNGAVLRGWGRESGEVNLSDFDDCDDFDGVRFGADGDFPGPINAFGEVIPEIDLDGNVLLDAEGNPVPMRGWIQSVIVEKVDPADFGLVRSNSYFVAPSGNDPGRPVDRFPLRVTVVVEYRGPYDAQPQEITRVVWIVPN